MEDFCWFAIAGRVFSIDFLRRRVINLENSLGTCVVWGKESTNHLFFFFLSIVRWFRFSRAFSFIGVAWSGGTISRFQSWQSGGGEGLSSGVL